MEEKMINKRNLSDIALPALSLFIVSLVIQVLIEYFTTFYINTYVIASIAIGCLFTQIFAYITCWFFVFRKNKSYKAVWINYIVWILIMNLGSVSEFLCL